MMSATKQQDSSRQIQLEWLEALFYGLQRNGFTGIVKIHMHAGGVRSARREEQLDLDWRAVNPSPRRKS